MNNELMMVRTLWWVARGRMIEAKRTEGKSRGASALEWAIISAILVTAAVLIGNAVYNRVQKSSGNLEKCTNAVC
ncbi:MAG: hypothetical protein GEU96_02795 [Propionibacteriales bacterium]|nr:hypothetical protein [Propionibacteriales bacterium]